MFSFFLLFSFPVCFFFIPLFCFPVPSQFCVPPSCDPFLTYLSYAVTFRIAPLLQCVHLKGPSFGDSQNAAKKLKKQVKCQKDISLTIFLSEHICPSPSLCVFFFRKILFASSCAILSNFLSGVSQPRNQNSLTKGC